MVGPAVKRTIVSANTSGSNPPGRQERLEPPATIGDGRRELAADVAQQPHPVLMVDGEELPVQMAVVVLEHEIGVAADGERQAIDGEHLVAELDLRGRGGDGHGCRHEGCRKPRDR